MSQACSTFGAITRGVAQSPQNAPAADSQCGRECASDAAGQSSGSGKALSTRFEREWRHLENLLRLLSRDEFPNSMETFTGNETKALKQPATVDLSFVVPVFDEAESLERLVQGILGACAMHGAIEIILVDDGSRDPSWQAILELRNRLPHSIRGIRLRGNHGKATALLAGFRAARGEIVFTMDADLQDDPAEIPRFLEKLKEGFDIVSGWKRVRRDPWHKVLPSRVFNRMLSFVGGVELHDQNCGYKCYRKSVIKTLLFRGEQHRVLPALAAQLGFRTGEIPVTHHARRHGRSKYGLERLFRGWCDLMAVGFFKRYRERPSHFVQKLATVFGAAGATGIGWALTNAMSGYSARDGLQLAGTCFGFSAVLLVQALLAELQLKTIASPNAELPIMEDTEAPVPLSHRRRERE